MKRSAKVLLCMLFIGVPEIGVPSETGKVPILCTFDLYHPHEDPDDHFDLATLFAIREFDLRGFVLEHGERQQRQPGRIPLEQMMYLTGRKVPFAVGLDKRLKSPEDDGRNCPAEMQSGVELILEALRRSPRKMTVFTTGSLRDVAAAWNRDPEVFRKKVHRLYINIGDSSVREDYNIDLDKNAFMAIMRSGLPIYWCVCDDGGPHTRGNRGLATLWILDEGKAINAAPKLLQNYFYYALSRSTDPKAVAFLSKPPEAAELKWKDNRGGPPRPMWSTAPFFHAADLCIVETSPGHWIARRTLHPGQCKVIPYDFVPVRVLMHDDGRTTLDFTRTGPGQEMFIFKVLDLANYDKILNSCLRELFEHIPLTENREEPSERSHE